MEELRLWIMPICALISAAAALWVWLTNPAKEAQATAAGTDDRVNKLERRVDGIELEMKHLPDAKTIQDLSIAVTEMRGDLKTLASQVETSVAVSERLQEYLLRQGK